MNVSEIITVPVILGFAYLVGIIVKSFKNDKLDDFIPDICIVVGVILGLISFYTIPDLIPANNWISACVIGGFSGLAATGANQAVRKLKAFFDGD